MPSWSQHFSTLARYNMWATRRLFASVDELPEDVYRRDVGLFFKSIHRTLNHLLLGEHHLWYVRFSEGRSPRLSLDEELETDRLRLKERLIAGAQAWPSLIQSWPAERFEGNLNYMTMRGQPANLPFSVTLAHVFNHGTHHRGQVTAALTALGRTIPELDLVYMLQEESTQS
ncbi:DinB family protein [Ottowia thiooxydans]|uniref:DinB family protein n=1 Tax=Ottowia thiooxydans TaxID=219182 RepID=UPI000425C5B4|nr:DinB family protein [Ottowia thiooxydans]